MSSFNPREMQLMACAFQSMRSAPDIDYAHMATLAGMTNPRSASNAMALIKKKLAAAMPPSADGSAPQITLSTPAKKRGKAQGDDGDGDGDESPSKKAKTPRTPRTPKTPKTPRTKAAAKVEKEVGVKKEVKKEVEEDEAQAGAEVEAEHAGGEEAEDADGGREDSCPYQTEI